jgi:hypothetical protein
MLDRRPPTDFFIYRKPRMERCREIRRLEGWRVEEGMVRASPSGCVD